MNQPATEGQLVNFRVPAKLHKEFKAVAKKRERTVSQELRFLMQRHIEENGNDDGE